MMELPLISKDTSKTTGVVPKLSEPLFHKGHKSPGLVKFLMPCNASCMGTLNINRESVPKKVKKKKGYC
jgi:hypothetical protein